MKGGKPDWGKVPMCGCGVPVYDCEEKAMPTLKLSETPRVDELCKQHGDSSADWETLYAEMREQARQLERELSALQNAAPSGEFTNRKPEANGEGPASAAPDYNKLCTYAAASRGKGRKG